MNAGSTNADAADVTETNGSWDITAETFIAASGTPFSAVTANVDYASIYNDGVTTGAVYVALITAVGGGGASITLSTTVKYGAKPSALGTGRSCKVNGAWASLAAPAALFAANATLSQSTRINIKAGTYANTTNNRIIVSDGSALIVFMLRGYNTTIGDIDTDNTLTKPAITFTTGRLVIQGDYVRFKALDFTGAHTTASSGQLSVTGTHFFADRIRCENTSANANSTSFSCAGNEMVVTRSWFKATSSAPVILLASPLAGLALFDMNTIKGGTHGIVLSNGAQLVIANSRFDSQAGDAIRVTSASRVICINNTLYSTTSDGIEMTVGMTIGYIGHNILSNIGAYGINSSLGTNVNNIHRIGNAYFSTTSGQENGFGDSPAIGAVTEGSAPLTSPSTQDFSVVSGATSKGLGAPGGFENITDISYLDAGAVQRQEAASGGGGVIARSLIAGGT